MNYTKVTERPSEQLVLNAMTTLVGLLSKHMLDYEYTARNYPEALPTRAERYGCSDELIRDARRYGHFFDDATMRSFRTKTYELINERFLIISDKSDWAPRDYRVVWVYRHNPTCNNPEHISKSIQPTDTRFKSLAAARKFAHEISGLINLIEQA